MRPATIDQINRSICRDYPLWPSPRPRRLRRWLGRRREDPLTIAEFCDKFVADRAAGRPMAWRWIGPDSQDGLGEQGAWVIDRADTGRAPCDKQDQPVEAEGGHEGVGDEGFG